MFAGQKVNTKKSEVIVSPNMCGWQRDFIKNVLGIKIVSNSGIYLGSELDTSRRKGSYLEVF